MTRTCFCEIHSTKVFFFGFSDAFDSNHGVCVLRMMDGLDIRDELETEGMLCLSVFVSLVQ